MDILKELIHFTLLLSREIPLSGAVAATRIVTGFRLQQTSAVSRFSSGEGQIVGIQAHPEWPGNVLANILRESMLGRGGQYEGYMGLEGSVVAERIEAIDQAPTHGRQLLQNWQQRVGIAA